MAGPVAQRVYDFYARFYDLSNWVFSRRLKGAIAAAAFRPGALVLDVGVGTGLSLGFYPSGLKLVGIDISRGMLGEARRKLDAGETAIVADNALLLQADALGLPFEDHAFDGLVMSHVISTVPDPARALREAIRVCRPGARLVLVNHFRSESPVLGAVEHMVDPVCRRLGWSSDLAASELLESAGVQGSVSTGPSLFQTIHLRKIGDRASVVRAPDEYGEPITA